MSFCFSLSSSSPAAHPFSSKKKEKKNIYRNALLDEEGILLGQRDRPRHGVGGLGVEVRAGEGRGCGERGDGREGGGGEERCCRERGGVAPSSGHAFFVFWELAPRSIRCSVPAGDGFVYLKERKQWRGERGRESVLTKKKKNVGFFFSLSSRLLDVAGMLFCFSFGSFAPIKVLRKRVFASLFLALFHFCNV